MSSCGHDLLLGGDGSSSTTAAALAELASGVAAFVRAKHDAFLEASAKGCSPPR